MRIKTYFLRSARGGLWIFILLTSFLLSGSVAAQQGTPIKPAKIVKLNGATVTSPGQPGWRMTRSDKVEVIFEMSGDANRSGAFAKMRDFDIPEDVGSFFQRLETLKKLEIDGLDIDSLHFNTTQFKETPCLQYDGIFRKVESYEYLSLYGYLCRHPLITGKVLQLEYSSRSNTRGFSETDIKLFRRYFDATQFTKVKGK